MDEDYTHKDNILVDPEIIKRITVHGRGDEVKALMHILHEDVPVLPF